MNYCKSCGCKTTNEEQPDPYIEDVGNRIEMVILCDSCYTDAVMDI